MLLKLCEAHSLAVLNPKELKINLFSQGDLIKLVTSFLKDQFLLVICFTIKFLDSKTFKSFVVAFTGFLHLSKELFIHVSISQLKTHV